LTIE
jgi:hypothetical protein